MIHATLMEPPQSTPTPAPNDALKTISRAVGDSNPLAADLAVRHAVTACWNALPADKRSLKSTQAVLHLLTRRALRALEISLGIATGAAAMPTAASEATPSARVGAAPLGESWDHLEDAKLCEGFAEGATIRELAARHQRSRGGIRARLVRIGLLEPGEKLPRKPRAKQPTPQDTPPEPPAER